MIIRVMTIIFALLVTNLGLADDGWLLVNVAVPFPNQALLHGEPVRACYKIKNIFTGVMQVTPINLDRAPGVMQVDTGTKTACGELPQCGGRIGANAICYIPFVYMPQTTIGTTVSNYITVQAEKEAGGPVSQSVKKYAVTVVGLVPPAIQLTSPASIYLNESKEIPVSITNNDVNNFAMKNMTYSVALDSLKDPGKLSIKNYGTCPAPKSATQLAAGSHCQLILQYTAPSEKNDAITAKLTACAYKDYCATGDASLKVEDRPAPGKVVMTKMSTIDLPTHVFTSDHNAKTVLYQVTNNYNNAQQVSFSFEPTTTAQHYAIIAPPVGDTSCTQKGGILAKGESCYINVQFKLTASATAGRFTYDLKPTAMAGTTVVQIANKPTAFAVVAVADPTLTALSPFDQPMINYQGDIVPTAAYTLHNDAANSAAFELSGFNLPATPDPILNWGTPTGSGQPDCRSLTGSQLKPGGNCTIYLAVNTSAVAAVSGNIGLTVDVETLTKVLQQPINVTIKSVDFSLQPQYLDLNTDFKPNARALSSSGDALFLGTLSSDKLPGGYIYRGEQSDTAHGASIHWKQVYHSSIEGTLSISQLSTDTHGDGTFFAVMNARYLSKCRLLRSTDSGLSWQALPFGAPDGSFFYSVMRDGATVYFSTKGDSKQKNPETVWTLKGTQWTLSKNSPAGVKNMKVNPGTHTLYALANDGMYTFDITKQTWQAVPHQKQLPGDFISTFNLINGSLYVGLNVDHTMYRYNATTQAWHQLPVQMATGPQSILSDGGTGTPATMYVGTAARGTEANFWYNNGSVWTSFKLTTPTSTIWRLVDFKGNLYAGTEQGVYRIDNPKKAPTAVAINKLSTTLPITAIIRANNVLYAATDGDGVFTKPLAAEGTDDDADWLAYAPTDAVKQVTHLAMNSATSRLYAIVQQGANADTLYRVNGATWEPAPGTVPATGLGKVLSMTQGNNTIFIGGVDAKTGTGLLTTYDDKFANLVLPAGTTRVASLQWWQEKLYAVLCKGHECTVASYDAQQNTWHTMGREMSDMASISVANNKLLLGTQAKGVFQWDEEQMQWLALPGTPLPPHVNLLALTGQATGNSPLYATIQITQGSKGGLYRYQNSGWQAVQIKGGSVDAERLLLSSGSGAGQSDLYIGDKTGNVYRYGRHHKYGEER